MAVTDLAQHRAPTAEPARTVTGMSSEQPDGLTVAARQLAACHAHSLDLMQRCARAIEDGNWPDLAEAAGALSVAADEVSAAAAALTRDTVATSPSQVLDLVQRHREQPAD